MQCNVEIPDFDKSPRPQFVVRRGAGAMMPTTQRQRVEIGTLLPDSMRSEVRGLNEAERPTYYAAEFPQEGEILFVSHWEFRFVDRTGRYFEGAAHVSKITLRRDRKSRKFRYIFACASRK
jgi:hypothetical protein